MTDYPSDPGCSSAADGSELGNPPPEEPAPIAGQGYTRVWGDEFNGTSLDLTKWKPAWILDPGSQNYAVSNGILHLTSRRSEGYPNVELNSVDLASGTPMHYWKGGYFEARARGPRAGGTGVRSG